MRLKRVALIGMLGLFIQSEASADTITASIDPGTTARVAWSDVNDPSPLPLGNTSVFDSDGDGIVQFTIPPADMALPSLVISLCWPGNFSGGITDVAMQGTVSFTAPISVFVPFRFVGFSSQDTSIRLVAQVVVEQLLADGGADVLFDPGEVLPITNGSTVGTSAITFRNGSSLSADPQVRILQLLNPVTLSSLPLFTGNAIVESIGIDTLTPIDTIAPIPEPSSLLLLSTGILGLIGYGWRRGSGHSTTAKKGQ